MAGPVQAASGMIAGMNPVLDTVTYVFCCIREGSSPEMDAAWAHALVSFREEEGLSLVLPIAVARGFGLPCDLPMRRIILTVFSALNGVGLTAAVACALAGEGIACNIIAAFHHDHVFVPESKADAALAALRRCQERNVDDR